MSPRAQSRGYSGSQLRSNEQKSQRNEIQKIRKII